ncbi:helix-turn-helix domain-containing protein [Brotaphodocola catenula]
MIREMQLLGCKTTKQNYSKYEKDLAHISASELVAIAQILSVSLEEIFCLTDFPLQ